MKKPSSKRQAMRVPRVERKKPLERFEIVVACSGEKQQRELYEELTARGWRCRVLTF
ncbi:MAG: hypothetical protein AB7K24_05765 [Gemmataceae bacterium]